MGPMTGWTVWRKMRSLADARNRTPDGQACSLDTSVGKIQKNCFQRPCQLLRLHKVDGKNIAFSFCGGSAERGAQAATLELCILHRITHSRQDCSEPEISPSLRTLSSLPTSSIICTHRDSNRRSQQFRGSTTTFRPHGHRGRLVWSKTGFLKWSS